MSQAEDTKDRLDTSDRILSNLVSTAFGKTTIIGIF